MNKFIFLGLVLFVLSVTEGLEIAHSTPFHVLGESVCAGGLNGFADDRGVVWLIYQGDITGGLVTDVLLVQSFDNGSTWTSPVNITHEGDRWEYDPAIMQDNSGRVWLFYTQLGVGNWFPEEGSSGILYKYSDDYGTTWSEPMTLVDSYGVIEKGVHALQDSNGRFWVAWAGKNISDNTYQLYVISSLDGLTWENKTFVPSFSGGYVPFLYSENGVLYVLYQDGHELRIKSYDGGWSGSTLIDKSEGRCDFNPSVVSLDGIKYVVYYKQLNTGKSYADVRLFYVTSRDMIDFSDPVQLLDSSYDQESNPFAMRVGPSLQIAWTSKSFGVTSKEKNKIVVSQFSPLGQKVRELESNQ